MVRAIILLATLVAGVLAADKYTTKYDNVDLDSLLNNERLLSRAFGCLMDEGGCTPDIAELKSEYLPSSSLKAFPKPSLVIPQGIP